MNWNDGSESYNKIAALEKALAESQRELTSAWSNLEDAQADNAANAEQAAIFQRQLAESQQALAMRDRELTEMSRIATKYRGQTKATEQERETLGAERDEARKNAEWLDVQRMKLTEVCHESNAVCVCGCPASEHESYGEDGEACSNEAHQCIRTSLAVQKQVAALTARLTELEGALRNLATFEVSVDGKPCWCGCTRLAGEAHFDDCHRARAALASTGRPQTSSPSTTGELDRCRSRN